ncbi:polysaccharide deacetylase family protein [Flavobacterium sp. MFBS3-15]|uniref:polysaccharide deacetylase family protein n=1 Tax=Flavobacterium sp. MFBS3-15 TaxID=2989816 RepID=UPI0022364E0C|nr:polysaccharide deacetylase family protein [Flavobacterium sp. MFBS3-15]MCW4468668.1 polysaccharide deacetylase family protein [Flavobacterium sp. MFBS3-15]
MRFYWVKTRWFIRKLFPGFVWNIPNTSKTVYLTFDDGPTPDVTEWVLDLLAEHDIKATFFCIGNNIEKHPDIFRKVIEAGHTVANHTFNHLNGWNTGNNKYFENIEACENFMEENNSARLFRPPYGKIKRSQKKEILKKGYRIVMWDVLSADFDTTITPEQCLQNVVKNTANGSIIIFHDSIKAQENLRHALPKAIKYLKEKGFQFAAID